MEKSVRAQNAPNSLRCLLALSASCCALLVGPGAFAQAPDVIPDVDDEEILEEDQILVTGSRIRRSGFDTPQPVTVLDAEAIGLTGETNLGNLLNQLPALGATFSSSSSTGFIGTTGLNLLDLRRLGIDRTLVLVDGRRHVGGLDVSPAVDINSIPIEMVERVEVITGGASAVYGADAVSGVVNFVLRDDFEGFRVNAQLGNADEGNNLTYSIRGTGGGNFADGRGNAVIAFDYRRSNGFLASERSYERENLSFVQNPNDGIGANDDPNVPDTILIENARLPLFNFAGLTLSTDDVLGLAPGGELVPYDLGEIFDNGRRSIGGDGVLLSDIGGSLQPDQEQIVFNGKLNYEVHEKVNFFVEGKYAQNNAQSFNGTGSFDTGIIIQNDNFFLSDASRQLLADQGLDSISVRRINNDFGERSDKITRETFRGVAGIEGDIRDNLSYELSYVYGRTNIVTTALNNRINPRFLAAYDAVAATQDVADAIDGVEVGDPVCRSTAAAATGGDPVLPNGEAAPSFAFENCVPLDVFGVGQASPEAIAFINDDTVRNEEIQQQVITLAFSGDTSGYLELPAGPIGFAFGGEYRKEEAFTRPAGLDQLGITFGNAIGTTEGEFDVWEGFFEASVPLLKDLPFAKELSVDGAVRLSDYSTVGQTTTWRVGGSWAPIEDIRFRSTFSRSVRAPNIGELFDGQNQTFIFPEDPCDAENLDAGGPQREANCRALGIPVGFQQDETSGNIPGTSGGNPNLGEETSEAFTVGAVFMPRFAPGWRLSVDFYDIDIDDAIIAPALDDVLSNCVDAETIDNSFCPLIERDPTTFQITGFTLTQQNVAALTARGIDFESSYSFDVPSFAGIANTGELDVRTIATYVLNRTDFPFQEFPDVEEREDGELGDPVWNIVNNITWRRNAFTFNYELRILDNQLLIEQDEFAIDPDIQFPFETSIEVYHDVQGRYQINDMFEVYAGINNITQNYPDAGLSGAGIDSAIFDNIGRFYYGGVAIRF